MGIDQVVAVILVARKMHLLHALDGIAAR